MVARSHMDASLEDGDASSSSAQIYGHLLKSLSRPGDILATDNCGVSGNHLVANGK